VGGGPTQPTVFQDVGGGSYPINESAWITQTPRTYTLSPDGGQPSHSSFTVQQAKGKDGKAVQNVTYSGFPYPGYNLSQTFVRPGRNYGSVRAANGRYVLQTDVVWNGVGQHVRQGVQWVPISIVSFTSADGFNWEYGGVIANWTAVVGNTSASAKYNPEVWGPSEIDLEMLSDKKTLLSVVRMDGDSACFSEAVPPNERGANTTTYRNYAASYSTDHGVSWSFPTPIEGAGCARPKVKRLPAGPMLLTGGRLCVENMTGIFLWVNGDGMAGYTSAPTALPATERAEGGDASSSVASDGWVRHSITAQHNRLWKGDPTYLFSNMVNDSSVFETLSYTSIIVTSPTSAAITYNKYWYEEFGPNKTVKHWPGPSANFMIQVELRLNPPAR
jgi:hypothetical protein